MTARRDPTDPQWLLGHIITAKPGTVTLCPDWEYRLKEGAGEVCTETVYHLMEHQPPLVRDDDGAVIATPAGRKQHGQRRAARPKPAVPPVIFQPAAGQAA